MLEHVGSTACRLRFAPQGDALDAQAGWKELLRGASGVVSTLGAFGSNELMYRVGAAPASWRGCCWQQREPVLWGLWS
jgi:hypothetical protein